MLRKERVHKQLDTAAKLDADMDGRSRAEEAASEAELYEEERREEDEVLAGARAHSVRAGGGQGSLRIEAEDERRTTRGRQRK